MELKGVREGGEGKGAIQKDGEGEANTRILYEVASRKIFVTG